MTPLPQRLLVILDRAACQPRSLQQASDLLLDAGALWWHLRDPAVTPLEWTALAEGARQRSVRWRGVVNGGPRWAHELGLGAHLKATQQKDRERRWNLLGRSVHDLDEVDTALRDAPDYLVAGPVFPTSCKPQATPIGIEGLRSLIDAAAGLPVLAIGGIQPEQVETVLDAGAAGVSIRSGVLAAEDPAAAARRYLDALPGDA